MPETTLGIQYPDAASLHPSADWWASLATTTDAVIRESVAGSLGSSYALADGSNLNTLTEPGYYDVTSVSTVNSLVNGPAQQGDLLNVQPGSLVVRVTSNNLVTQTLYSYGNSGVWTRAATNTAATNWTRWSQMAATLAAGSLPSGTDVLTYSGGNFRGNWMVSEANAPTITNLPAQVPGLLMVLSPESSMAMLVFRSFERPSRVWSNVRRIGTNSWHGWTLETPSASTGSDAGVPASHPVRAESARNRRGGSIGTGGKAVLALRFDHGWGNFGSIVLPKLRELGLPASICANSDNWARPENNGLGPADVTPWLIEDGIELWNHSADHEDHLDPAGIYDSIVGGAERLRAQFPTVAIDGWMPHGSAAIDDVRGKYDGLFNSSKDVHFDSYAGQLVMAYHGLVSGYRPGTILRLNGSPMAGASHYTWDSATLEQVQAKVNEAIQYGMGSVIMLHPSMIGDPDRASAALVDNVLTWIAAQRDAGLIEVMTVGGLYHADKSASWRDNLLLPMASSSAVGAGSSIVASTPSSIMSGQRGGVRRIEVDIEMSSAGTVAVNVEGCGTRTLSAPAGRSKIARYVTVPLDATRCWVSATPSVAATVHNIAALAA